MAHLSAPHGWPQTAAWLQREAFPLKRILILARTGRQIPLGKWRLVETDMLNKRNHALTTLVFGLLLAACGGGGDWFLPFWEPSDVQVVDVDGDGRLDILTIAQFITSESHREGHLVVRRQTAPGIFGAPQRYLVGVNPWKLVVADIDGDGAPDLVVADATTVGSGLGAVWLLKQNAASRGAFLPPQRLMETASTPYAIAVGDVNGDNVPDLVFTSQGSDVKGATLLAQNPARRGSFLPARPLDVQDRVDAVVIADLNGDGRKDIVLRLASLVNGVSQSKLGVFYQQAGGTLAPWEELPSDQTGINSNLLASIDADRDGSMDIVEYFTPGSTDYQSQITTLLQTRSGTFTRVDSPLPEVTGDGAAVADLDSDGRPDFVMVGTALDIVLQGAAGAFRYTRNLHLPNHACAVAVADLNGDGLSDFIVLVNGDHFYGVYQLLQSAGAPGTYLAPRFLD